MVAFVDLLGFSDRVKAIKTPADFAAVEIDVRRAQEFFDHKPTDGTIKKVHQLTSKRVLAFSDCLAVSVATNSTLMKSQGAFDVLANEIWLLGLAQARCVGHNIFLRGGVGLGFWHYRKDVIVSPAMVRAVDLEKAANVPMIAIDDGLYEFLDGHWGHHCYSPDIDPLVKHVRTFTDVPGGQHHRFIDYFLIWLDSVDGWISPEKKQAYDAADRDGRQLMREEAEFEACL
jgi:hypothetical protein